MKKILISCIVLLSVSSNAFAWNDSINTNKLTDVKNGWAGQRSTTGASSWREHPDLHVRCTEDNFKIYIDWKQYIGKSSPKVTYRFDKQAQITRHFSGSTDGTATILRSGYIHSFLDKMKKNNTLRVRTHDYNGTALGMATFSLKGFTKSYNKACGWAEAAKTEKARIQAEAVAKAEAAKKLAQLNNPYPHREHWTKDRLTQLQRLENCILADVSDPFKDRRKYCSSKSDLATVTYWNFYYDMYKYRN